MHSFTSSSESIAGNHGPRATYASTIVSMAATLLLLCLAGAVRSRMIGDTVTGIPPELFFQQKVLSEGPYRVVLAGDSRVYRGLVPEEFARVAGIAADDVLNFGFSSCAYANSYLARIDELLRGDGPRTAILCLDARSFSREALQRNDFLHYAELGRTIRASRVHRWQHEISRPLEQIAQSRYFRPLERSELLRIARAGRISPDPHGVFSCQYFSPTGWVSSHQEPHRRDLYYDLYEEYARSDRVDTDALRAMLGYVRRWSARGVRVYATRLPVDAGIRHREDCVGLDWLAFREQLGRAGGQWIELPHDNYDTYDGSHLDATSARRYSVDLACEIVNRDLRVGLETRTRKPLREPWR